MQHYEGASNLFGRHTLFAYELEFRKLAFARFGRRNLPTSPPVLFRLPPGGTFRRPGWLRSFRQNKFGCLPWDKQPHLRAVPGNWLVAIRRSLHYCGGSRGFGRPGWLRSF